MNDVFPTTGNYFTDNIDPKRWQKIKSDLNIQVKPRVTSGKHILICLQRNGGWSMGGLMPMQWLNNTITKLQRHTDRKIIVRAHPGDKRAKEYLRVTPTRSKNYNNPVLYKIFKCLCSSYI